MNKPTLYVMIGIPGSGKSTEAKKISEEKDATIFSADEYRMNLFGTLESSPQYNKKTFSKLHNDLYYHLKAGRNAILDATSTHLSDRVSTIQFHGEIANIVYVYMKTSLMICLWRNNLRERPVPSSVIRRMYRQMDEPSLSEGCQYIRTLELIVER